MDYYTLFIGLVFFVWVIFYLNQLHKKEIKSIKKDYDQLIGYIENINKEIEEKKEEILNLQIENLELINQIKNYKEKYQK